MVGNSRPRRDDQYTIRKWIIVQGQLVLTTPTHIGSGDAEGAADIALQRDSITRKALLPGSTLAGALRDYLRALEQGWQRCEPKDDTEAGKGLAERLFGGRKGDEQGGQSLVLISDALSMEETPRVEMRDGVSIDPVRRTPKSQGKYDLELLAAGTSFRLQFTFGIPATLDLAGEQLLTSAFVTALTGLAQSQISLGMKKRRGFGRCKVDNWQVWSFDITVPRQLTQWLAFERKYAGFTAQAKPLSLLGSLLRGDKDRRKTVAVTAQFAIKGSLLIRAEQDEGVKGPDVRHLHARQASGNDRPVISGTGLAGVLRHRAERIANTIAPGSGEAFARRMFGDVPQHSTDPFIARASRLVVHESAIAIERVHAKLVQNRIAIDRFTGGVFDGALFNEQPVFARSSDRPHVELKVELRDPRPPEIGMLLLLLKDLWTGDLPIGGEASVGRGRLAGRIATITCNGQSSPLATFQGDGLKSGDASLLNRYVSTLHKVLNRYVSLLAERRKRE